LSQYLLETSGGEPLTPDDVAEIIVFAATRKENVVFADSLVFPSHQVWLPDSIFALIWVSFFPQDSNVQHAATTADFSQAASTLIHKS
jgi:hypothetical protein